MKTILETITGKVRNSRRGNIYISVIILLIVFTTISLVSDSFLRMSNFKNYPGQVVIFLCIALGQMFVLLTGNLDLTVGTMVSLTTCIASVESIAPGLRIVLIISAALAVGIINGVNVAYLGFNPIILTLITSIFIKGIALLIRPKPGGQAPSILNRLSSGSLLGIPSSLIVIVIVILFCVILLRKTRFGIHLYAVGGSPANAKLYGLNTVWITTWSYVLCSLFAALGGMILAGRISAGNALVGDPMLIESIIIVALGGAALSGGIGGVAGTVIGSFLLLIIKNGMNMAAVSVYLQSVVKSVILIIVISLQRRKMFGI